MKRSIALGALALVTLLTAPAFSQDIRFAVPQKGSREEKAVRSLVGPDVEITGSAVVDVNADGSGEVLVRSDCDKTGFCRTWLFSQYRGRWSKVLEDRTDRMSVIETDDRAGRMRSISTRAGVWKWDVDRYSFDVAGSGDLASFTDLPADRLDAIAAQFGPGARTLAASGKAGVDVAAVQASRNAKPVLVARLKGDGLCGLLLGCPFRILSVEDGSYRTLLTGMTAGDVSISRTTMRGDGWLDVVVARPKGGYGLYAWDGKSYVDLTN